jgi:hypothetical protein
VGASEKDGLAVGFSVSEDVGGTFAIGLSMTTSSASTKPSRLMASQLTVPIKTIAKNTINTTGRFDFGCFPGVTRK